MPQVALPGGWHGGAVPSDPTGDLTVVEVLGVLAQVGDASMGQPSGHGARTALYAADLAAAIDLPREVQLDCAVAALVMWTGCPANAGRFAEMLGDDVDGRAALVEHRAPSGVPDLAGGSEWRAAATVHCEVAREVALGLGLTDRVADALFLLYPDPARTSVDPLPRLVAELVAWCSDAEIARRCTPARLPAASSPGDEAFRPAVRRRLHGWDEIDRADPWRLLTQYLGPAEPLRGADRRRMLEVVADVADSKDERAPGFSRRTRDPVAGRSSSSPGEAIVAEAALLHRLGRVAVPSRALARPAPLRAEDWERVRLWPLLTEHMTRRSPSLGAAARLASLVRERLDGSGFSRGLDGSALPAEARLLAAASAYVALTSPRADRPAATSRQAAATLRRQARDGRLDSAAVDAVLDAARTGAAARMAAPAGSLLTERERQVVAVLASGATNREIAAELRISVHTARRHLEHCFAELGVTTRTAAVLAARRHGLLPAETAIAGRSDGSRGARHDL
jgi:DNA-binding CsgD family transcriptional regulator